MNSYPLLEQLITRFGFRRGLRNLWTPPSEDDFQRLASSLGRAVPLEYRAFLETCGDGIFGDDDFRVVATIREGETVRPEYFYALAKGREGGLEDQWEDLKDRIPHGVIPIVSDAGGNQLCLDVAGASPGSVWFWDHEESGFTTSSEDDAREEAGDQGGPYTGMYRMADTFEDFLLSMRRVSY